MDTFKNVTVSVPMKPQYFNGTVNGTLLHYYLENFVVHSHFQNPGQSIINDKFTVVRIFKST